MQIYQCNSPVLSSYFRYLNEDQDTASDRVEKNTELYKQQSQEEEVD
jgi:hypothetical protein